MTEKLAIRRSARLMIIDTTGRLLLFHYHDVHQAPFWATAGGELKPGENYLEAAQRELQEETGLTVAVGKPLKDRDATYAVARSVSARWLERYFLVRCPTQSNIQNQSWTDEEKSTIHAWHWWSLDDMKKQPSTLFKPDWLPDLLEQILAEDAVTQSKQP